MSSQDHLSRCSTANQRRSFVAEVVVVSCEPGSPNSLFHRVNTGNLFSIAANVEYMDGLFRNLSPQQWDPATRRLRGCYGKPTLGIYVITAEGGEEYILPMCCYCNNELEDEIFEAWKIGLASSHNLQNPFMIQTDFPPSVRPQSNSYL